MYNQQPPTADDKDTDIVMTSAQLFEAFSKDNAHADSAFQNKTIELSGYIEEINNNGEVVDVALTSENPLNSINVQLSSEASKEFNHKVGDTIRLKALYVGVLSDIGMNIELKEGVEVKPE